jgi:hypothetical protein
MNHVFSRLNAKYWRSTSRTLFSTFVTEAVGGPVLEAMTDHAGPVNAAEARVMIRVMRCRRFRSWFFGSELKWGGSLESDSGPSVYARP